MKCDLKAKTITTTSLSLDELFCIYHCEIVKEIWDILHVTLECTIEFKSSRLKALTHEYELFRMKPEENIYDMQKRFTYITSHMRTLGIFFFKMRTWL